MNLPYRTHTWLLGPVMGQFHIRIQLYVKTLRFLHYMSNSTNAVVAYIYSMANLSSMSPLGKNISWFRFSFGVNFHNNLSRNIALVRNAHNFSLYQQGLINNIRDLIAIRDGKNDVMLDNFDSDMIKSMITNIACD